MGTRCGTAISKEIESAGIPVALISPLVPTALFCGAYRIVPGYAIVHPLGNPSLSPQREKEMRRRIVTTALESMEIEVTGGRVFNWS
ncbi:MAG: hypothetical protein CVU57_01415 [Deltaproteobacteria bacterium HGW-Deltaproteobacteria-15]|nr:MAG: hypothetical protein CVU57_01415 [Deltaproteobacteria bacterium HGW-Deltaproteobacteria-15]